jgi:Protein of unknown function (DUF2846)
MNLDEFSSTIVLPGRLSVTMKLILNSGIVCLTLFLSTVLCVAQQKAIVLAEGTTLNVVTAQEISSKTAIPGKAVEFKVDEDVLIDGHVLISRGTQATGRVIHAEPSGRIGKSGKLGIVVESTTTIDGQPLRLRAAKGKEGKDKTLSTSLLAGTVSYFFLLRKGTEANIPAGTRVAVAVAEEKRFHLEGVTRVADNLPVAANSTGAAESAAARSVTVFIYRPEKFMGYQKSPSVFCDGVKLVRLDNGRYFALQLTPGKHIVHLTDKKKGYEVDMGAGQTFYFRVGIETTIWADRGKLTLEDADKALPEIKKLKFIGKENIKDHSMVLDSDPTKP